ncbi:MAG: OmpA family protein, partial [Bacteroidia bacterium]|nr:OmpA family protein [Bacteroidia bacterium]
KDGGWASRNLGPEINTPFDEDAPFFHVDERTLFFSSNGHSTIGGFDVFKSLLLDDGGWSKPENLGYPVNTPADEIYFIMTADGSTAYLTSTRQGGKGLKDIYKLEFSKADVVVQKPIPLFKGKIVDDETGETITETFVTVIDNLSKDTLLSKTTPGNFILPLLHDKSYNISIAAKDYLFHSENIIFSKDSFIVEEFVTTIRLKKIKPGSKVILNNIFFDFDKATLRKESFIELEALAKLLRENPYVKVGIYGHTDNTGSTEYNIKLSQERAESVVNYLISRGIPTHRLLAKGFGASQPIESNETSAGRSKNRRTELIILSN